jgi:two-component system sensor histidine kinase TctE
MSPFRFSHMKSLKRRLALWVLLPAVLISCADLIFTYNSTDDIATLVQQQLLKGSAKIISEQLMMVDGSYEIDVPPAAFELFEDNEQDLVYYSVRSKSGLLIAGDGELKPYSGPLQIEQEKYFLTTIRGDPVRVIAYKHALPSTAHSDYAITQIGQTLRGHDAFRSDLVRLTIREHLMLLSIMVIGFVIAFHWTLSPLIQFGKTLLKRKPGSLERLDAINAPAELAPIIFAMNDYVIRLDKTLSSYEQFVANTAHHLRTSFAILTSQINFGRRNPGIDQTQLEVLTALQRSVAQGGKVINQLLVLAAVEQGRHHSHVADTVNMAQTIQSVMEELAPLAQQKNIELGVDGIDAGISIAAPQHLLREVISNLLDNSIHHMTQEGTVTVSLLRLPSSALLRVSDTGPGIPESERTRVFERFYRLDNSKPNSSGLGLAIVNEICGSLHADVTLHTPENGIGLQVEIAFPVKW